MGLVMTLVNANIANVREAVQRLMDGEEFFINGWRLYFDQSIYENPFRGHNGLLVQSLTSFNNYAEWRRKAEWWEDIKKPIPCWVGDIEPLSWNIIALVKERMENGKYRDTCSNPWSYAKPLTQDDILEK